MSVQNDLVNLELALYRKLLRINQAIRTAKAQNQSLVLLKHHRKTIDQTYSKVRVLLTKQHACSEAELKQCFQDCYQVFKDHG